ncbi:MAG: CTP-dependent riboflavin kinase [Candidatus Thermoplasmatota archaeon]|jgi:riboflavin kinase|nr:CTP-dependent riboflavin kinase [Candidatus Thermoplasmatota archaeon]MCL5963571.1 CTP-dependent riboflavin kinase [Candidatus Thermoplasmatota archaeon]
MVDMESLNIVQILKLIAHEYVNRGDTIMTTAEIGNALHFSQQSASRWLTILENKAYIKRYRIANKEKIIITSYGWQILEREYNEYKFIFENPKQLLITGTVTSGFGEGSYYIGRGGYMKQFKELIGITPFLGTLNIRLDSSEFNKLDLLKCKYGTIINGFSADGRTYGDVTLYKAALSGTVCFVIIPERGHHPDVIEIISEFNLRSRLNLKDDDIVKVYIKLVDGDYERC